MHDSTKYDYSFKYGNKNVLLHLAQAMTSHTLDVKCPANAIRRVIFRGETHWESYLYIDVNMDMRK